MKFICHLQKLSDKRLRLAVSATLSDGHNPDQIKAGAPFKLEKNGRSYISVMGYTWRYDHEEEEIVMVRHNASTMFVLET